MNTDYSTTLNRCIQEIIQIIGASNIDSDEKNAVITTFTQSLADNICTPSQISNSDYLIHSASVCHIDSRIMSVYQMRQASADQIKYTLSLCARQAENIRLFSEKQWELPSAIHINIKEIETDLRKRLDSMSFSDQLVALDNRIDELLNEAKTTLSVEQCDSILKLIEELQTYLSEAQRRKYQLPSIHNRDVSRTISTVMALKKVALAREGLYQRITATDSKISEIERDVQSTREQWVEIINLSKKQQDQFNECQQQRWAIPKIHFPAVTALIDKYVTYLAMDDLDQEITNQQPVSKQNQAAYLSNCSHQDQNIQQCQAHGWRIPALKTANPGEIVERANQERERREKEIREFRDRAASLDKRIDMMYQSNCSAPTTSACDKIDDLIRELMDLFQAAIQKDIQLSNVKNIRQQNESVSLQIVREADFASLRKQAELRQQLISQLQEKERQLDEVASAPSITPELCSSVFQLCQTHDELYDKLKKNGWDSSDSHHSDVVATRSRFQTYQSMFDQDSSISAEIRRISQKTNSEINYDTIIRLLSDQEKLVDKCNQNQWVLPKLVVTNLASKRRDYQAEVKQQLQIKEEQKRKREIEEAKAAKIKRIKRGFILSGIGAVAVICLIFGGILLSRRGKIAFPFSPDYARGSDCDTIQTELKQLGFTDIKTVSDDSGWKKDNTVIGMTVDDTDAFEQGKYYKADTKIIIRYSSKNRVDVSSVLENWEDYEYKDIQNKLKSAGFTNIKLEDKDEFSKEKNSLVAEIALNGMSYYGEQWYVPTTAPITITYYTYKIRIGANESSFIGQDYQKVEEKLKKAGFTNIQKQEVTDGWEKNNSVVSLLVNNSAEYEETASYSPDTKILIKYSAGERIDVTNLVENWNSVEAKVLRESFEQNGFKDISIQDETTNKIKENKLVAGILFNDKSFESGDCYLPKGTKIVIKRYILNLSAGRNSGDYIGKNYHDVANELKEKGFTNIHLLRADDLWIAEWDDCKVKSITIDGKSSFSASDKFTFNDRIDIVVHTYKWLDYSDIAEKAS